MRLSSVLLLALFPLACQRSPVARQAQPDPRSATAEIEPADADDEGMIMRTYAVDAERAREVRSVLGRLLHGANEQPDRGRVEELGGGHIVVVAPPGVHRGIEQMLENMAETTAAGATRSVDVSYWFVLAEPADEGNNAAEFPAIAHALEEVAAHRGPVRFDLVEHTSLRSLLNEHADAIGSRFGTKHIVSSVDERYIADLELRPTMMAGPPGRAWHGRLQTRVVVEPGTLLVVGQSGYAEGPQPGSREEEADPTLYYIVRIDAHDS